MGNASAIPKRPPVPVGKTRICVSGFGLSHNVSRAHQVATAIGSNFADRYETWYYFSTMGFTRFLDQIKAELPDSEKSKQSTTDKNTTVADHHSAPFIWFETGGTADADGAAEGKTYDVKGGRDMFCAWAVKEFPDDAKIQELAGAPPPLSELLVKSGNSGTWEQGSSS